VYNLNIGYLYIYYTSYEVILMPEISPQSLEQLVTRIFRAVGASENEAALVARELVTTDRMGIDSHGVLRVPQYVGWVERGQIVPGAPISVVRETPSAAVVDCGHGFGQVSAYKALEIATAKARECSVSCVVTLNCNHVGRAGAYAQRAAEQDLVCLVTVNSPYAGHFVAPWGGREGRLGTNPIAYGVPCDGFPIVGDISTGAIAEGKIKSLMNKAQLLPPDTVLDAQGEITRDPTAFYGPPKGAILPFGGELGHRGYVLGLLVEILGGVLAGNSTDDQTVTGNGICFIAIDPTAFLPLERFKSLVRETVLYLKSSLLAQGYARIFVPGELEFGRSRMVSKIELPPTTWEAIVQVANRLGVTVG
jgi:uncharacterized oxidoreductase